MKNKILLIADKLFTRKTSAHSIAQEVTRQGAQPVFLSVDDLVAKRDSLDVFYDKGVCSIRLRKRGRILELTKDIRSVLYWRPRLLDDLDARKRLSKTEYSFFFDEWRLFLRGIFFSLKSCFWLNPYPDNLQLQEKVYQLQIAQQIGFLIPFTFITTSLKHARAVLADSKHDFIYKSFAPLMVERKNRHGKDKALFLYTSPVKKTELRDFETEYPTPNIFQHYVSKKREVRITVVGKKVFAAEVDSQALEAGKHDWRKAIHTLPFRVHSLPRGIERKCFRLMRKLGLNYCTIDMIVTPKDEYVFLELNPNGQYGWIEGMTKQPITKNIARMLIEGTINYKVIKK
ncbi:hypothetical protein ACFL38_01235 [Candidatus Omnitrophota bacterium]